MKRKCQECGNEYKTTDKRRKFCSLLCYHAKSRRFPNKGTFKEGITPWNTGTVGVMKANSGSFQPGQQCATREKLRSVKIRKGKNGVLRAWVKVSELGSPSDWKLRAVAKWEKHRGPLRPGWLVHHKDRNTLNDRLSNLATMSRADHLNEHRGEFVKARKRNHANRLRHAESAA